ncbi:Rab proteins geranylgeranyltransferase component A [Puccinia graminis f. sp. tritici]|uniref:Rab proteins geranylgeranyltransferase component A n=1 Tax=Puccinia graminis f. sp. tritici TaxID=56615 RepID=A0A5B0NC73_PUCGR|nr:Rab proteins geranylgeranyltransferase component A [Puccinia graminis f. sp. tritici]
MITNPRLVTVIGALSLSAVEDPAAGPVLGRLKTLLSAIGRHPSATLSALPAALLLGEYGGGGEWAEGFVRAAAVTGRATQVLGRPVLSLRQSIDGTQQRWIIRLGRQSGHPVGGEDHLEFSAGRLLVSQQYLSLLLPDISPPPTAYTISRAIAIVGRSGLDKLNQLGKVETAEPRGSHALVVFPPKEGCADRRPVHALIVGPDSGSCPEDEQIIYLSSIIPAPDPTFDPTQLLEPVLDRLLRSASSSAPQEVLRSSTFYSQCVPHLPPPSTTPSASWIVPSWPAEPERSGLAEVVEWAAETAENLAKQLVSTSDSSLE